MKRFVLSATVVCFFSIPAMAQGYRSLDQYRTEIGVMAGGAFYIGDANPTKLFNRTGFAWGGEFRYNFNPRFALKAYAMNATVAGDTRDYNNKYPGDAYAKFEKNFWDFGLNIEFNFFDYGLPKYLSDSYWLTPYIFVGTGLTASDDNFGGSPSFDFNLPYGVGIKMKVGNRFNFGVEWSLHTLFLDNFEEVDEESALLDNPYGFQEISNTKNNDRYSIAKAFFSIDLFKRMHCKR